MSRRILEQGPDVTATTPRQVRDLAAPDLHALVDPRWGDVGDDTASPERRSLLSLLGSLLIEISLPKLLFAATVLLVLPAGIGFVVLTGVLDEQALVSLCDVLDQVVRKRVGGSDDGCRR